jgi:hypothetical protein
MLIRQDAVFPLRKCDSVPIDREPASLVQEDAAIFSLAARLGLLLIFKTHLTAGIEDDQLRGSVDLVTSGAQQYVVPAIALVKLPRSLKELKELADHIVF